MIWDQMDEIIVILEGVNSQGLSRSFCNDYLWGKCFWASVHRVIKVETVVPRIGHYVKIASRPSALLTPDRHPTG